MAHASFLVLSPRSAAGRGKGKGVAGIPQGKEAQLTFPPLTPFDHHHPGRERKKRERRQLEQGQPEPEPFHPRRRGAWQGGGGGEKGRRGGSRYRALLLTPASFRRSEVGKRKRKENLLTDQPEGKGKSGADFPFPIFFKGDVQSIQGKGGGGEGKRGGRRSVHVAQWP